MPGKMKKGQSIFIPFKDGESIYDSQNKARMYMSEEKFRASFPQWRFGEVELVEYVPKYSEAVTKWISVEERLPEKSVPVLAYKDGRIWYCERNWQSGCWESLSFSATKEYGMYWSKGPTHWMPLPEGPKEEV